MTIVSIRTWRVSIPFETGGPREGLRPGLKAWREMEALIVRVETADGIVGWGEAFGHFANAGTEAILASLIGPWFIGKDSRAITRVMDEAQRAFFGFGRGGPVMYALSGIDIALWDIAAKRAGQPLFRLLGGNQNTLTCYASLMRYGGNLEAVARCTKEAAARGYPLVKLHEREIAAFEAARDAVPPNVGIALDVNAPWSVAEASEVARAISDRGFAWIEEPVWPPEDVESLAVIRRQGVPVAAGENITTLYDVRRALEAGALDVLQPSVVKAGGITAMLRVFALAQAFPVAVVPHCFFWGPGYLATAHVAAAQPRPPLLETAYISLERNPHPLFDPQSSTLALPDAPGLGFEPDWEVVEAYTVSRGEIC